MADGWAVVVTMKVLGGGVSEQTYYAHIPDKAGAESAVKNHISAARDVKVQAKAPVKHGSFVAMKIAEGAVDQWIGTVPLAAM